MLLDSVKGVIGLFALAIIVYLIYRVLRYNVFASPSKNDKSHYNRYFLHFKGVPIPDLEQVPSLKGKVSVYRKTKDGYLVESVIAGSDIKQALKETLGYTNQDLVVTSGFYNLTSH